MRADALRNREALLRATIDLILEVGGEPTRDAIADSAGVGVGTLYRHFPDQQGLLHAVARHVLDRTIAAGEGVLATASGADALRRYMHLALDNDLGVVNLIYPLLDSPDWPELRERAEKVLTTLVDDAQREGEIRPDVTAVDVGFAIIRVCRPLGVDVPTKTEREFAHRHIDVYVDGLTDPARGG